MSCQLPWQHFHSDSFCYFVVFRVTGCTFFSPLWWSQMAQLIKGKDVKKELRHLILSLQFPAQNNYKLSRPFEADASVDFTHVPVVTLRWELIWAACQQSGKPEAEVVLKWKLSLPTSFYARWPRWKQLTTSAGLKCNVHLHLSPALFSSSECKYNLNTWLTSFNLVLWVSCWREASGSCRAWKNSSSLVSHCVLTAAAWRGSDSGELFTSNRESRLWITLAFATRLELYLQLWLIMREKKVCRSRVFADQRKSTHVKWIKVSRTQRTVTDVTFFGFFFSSTKKWTASQTTATVLFHRRQERMDAGRL